MSKKKPNLNTATSSKITEPHGVGDMTVKSIKNHNKANGDIKDSKELGNLPAIGKMKVKKLEDESQTKKGGLSTNSTETKEDVNKLVNKLKI